MKQIYMIVAVAVIAVGIAGYGGYQSGYSKGYETAKAEGDKAVQEIRDILARKEAEEKAAKAKAQELFKQQDEHRERYRGNW